MIISKKEWLENSPALFNEEVAALEAQINDKLTNFDGKNIRIDVSGVSELVKKRVIETLRIRGWEPWLDIGGRTLAIR